MEEEERGRDNINKIEEEIEDDKNNSIILLYKIIG